MIMRGLGAVGRDGARWRQDSKSIATIAAFLLTMKNGKKTTCIHLENQSRQYIEIYYSGAIIIRN
jgi:hypothetical protein